MDWMRALWVLPPVALMAMCAWILLGSHGTSVNTQLGIVLLLTAVGSLRQGLLARRSAGGFLSLVLFAASAFCALAGLFALYH